jgi:hypothetical protein
MVPETPKSRQHAGLGNPNKNKSIEVCLFRGKMLIACGSNPQLCWEKTSLGGKKYDQVHECGHRHDPGRLGNLRVSWWIFRHSRLDKKRIVNILNMLVGLQFLGLSHLQFLGYYHSLDVFDQLQTGIIKVGAQGLPS